jgi:uncharacterized coiled-coil DUF342 family protein
VTSEKTRRKEEIREEIRKLREEAKTANARIKGFTEQRNQMNEQVKKAREEIAGLKTERDAINEKVKLLKQQRDAVRAKSEPIIKEIEAAKEKIFELRKKLPRERQQDLQEELQAIEWKISTTSLDLQEEKRLIEQVKEVEILLANYKRIDNQKSKINDLIAQRKVVDAEADVFHKELTDLAKKSQEIHMVMIEKVNAVKISRAQADSLHQSYLKTKEELPPLYEKITELSMQLRGLDASLREETKARKNAHEQAARENQQAIKEKEQSIKQKLEAEAKDKLQKGEKLSWNEFQLVMGEDSKDDAETQD